MIHHKDYTGGPIKLTPKEIQRGEEDWTIVVRPQPNGTKMVTAVQVSTGKIFGSRVSIVDDDSDIPEAVKQELRMLSKMGMGGNLADASRFREASLSLDDYVRLLS